MPFRLLLTTAAAVLLFGPPSIRIDPVAGGTTPPVAGAVFMVTARHHGDSTGFSVTGRAEGIVRGQRVSRPLVLTPVRGRNGFYGVTRQWEGGAPWVLVLTVSEGGHDQYGAAEAMVKIAPDGRVTGIDYPLGKLPEGIPWPRKVTAAEIDDALRALARP